MKKLLFTAISALAVAGVAQAAESTQFGAMQVLSTTKRTLVAIPWDNSAAGGGDIVVSNLVLTANLTAGDTLDTVASDGSRLNRWTLREGAKKVLYWESGNMVGENWQAVTPSADKTTVPRGSSVILIRQAFTNNLGQAIPFFVMGQVASSASSTTITAGTSDKPVYNMLAPPSTVAQGLNGGDHGATWSGTAPDANDRIYIPGAAGLNTELRYAVPEDGSGSSAVWCENTTVETTIYGKTVKTTKLAPFGGTIPVGTGFWYLSKGGSPTVTWKDVPVAQ